MIFSDSERERYRKELEAASEAGDVKRVRELIDQIRLLGDIREDMIKSTGIQEYSKYSTHSQDEQCKPLTYDSLSDYIKKLGFNVKQQPKSFRDTLQQGFRDNGWTW